MINKQFFQKLKKEYLDFEKERHEIIKTSSDALRNSKQAIFALHKQDYRSAEKIIKDVEDNFKTLAKKFKRIEKLQYIGAYQAATEEYVEAKLFYQFLNNKKLSSITEVKINLEQYLGGLCDFTGELTRRAVKLASQKQFKEIELYSQITEDIIGQLIQFNLTKNLRVKYDQANRNLKKLEEIIYELSLKN